MKAFEELVMNADFTLVPKDAPKQAPPVQVQTVVV